MSIIQGISDQDLLEKIKSYQALRDDGCFYWRGRKSPKGYARLYINGEDYRVSRLIVAIKFNLSIRGSFVAMHSCDYTTCTNEEHLKPGTQLDNINDCIAKGRYNTASRGKNNSIKTHCPKGHEYTLENTRMQGTSRHCKICARVKSDIRSASKKASRHARGLRHRWMKKDDK